MYKPAILTLSILAATSVQAENLELPATAAIIAHSESIERPLDQVTFTDAAGTQIPLRFTTGLGSAAYHAAGDDDRTFYTLSDRGVNIKCSDDLDITGVDICADGKIFPVPNYTPSIYQLSRIKQQWVIADVVQLKNSAGLPISGLPNPLTLTDTEEAFDINGNPIALDPEGLDTEALLQLSDGSFWVSDEYAPSIVHVAADGRVLKRLVPAGIESDLSGAGYPVEGALPGILAKRKLNRGIESIAVSPDENFLYFALQSPLANPDKDAYEASRNVRLFKMDLNTMTILGEYVYVLDLPETFAADDTSKQNKVKVSEMAAVDTDNLVILERISNTTKLYQVTLDEASNILDSEWDSEVTSPSLEQTADLAAAGIEPINKTLALDSAVDIPGVLPAKVEGIAIMSDTEIQLINDNDFGIEGDATTLVHLRKPQGFFSH